MTAHEPHIEIVRTDSEQPWHARIRAANGEVTWHTENYASLRGARDALVLLGRTFSPVGLARIASDEIGNRFLDVWFDSDELELGATFAIPVRYVDERVAES